MSRRRQEEGRLSQANRVFFKRLSTDFFYSPRYHPAFSGGGRLRACSTYGLMLRACLYAWRKSGAHETIAAEAARVRLPAVTCARQMRICGPLFFASQISQIFRGLLSVFHKMVIYSLITFAFRLLAIFQPFGRFRQN